MTPLYYLVLMISADPVATPPQVLGAYSSKVECTHISDSTPSRTFCVKAIAGKTLEQNIKAVNVLLD